MSQVPSLNHKKYIYTDNHATLNLIFHFFSDQSSTYYIESINNKYHNLHDLLKNENVTLEMFEGYPGKVIKYLVDEGHLFFNGGGFVKFKDEVFILLMKELHENGVINYWHSPWVVRQKIDEMLKAEMLHSEDTLFSKQEIEYLNFHLNKRQFSNGLDLRNKYLHGTNGSSEQEHEQEYFILLRILVLVLLKIDNDLAISHHNQD